MGNMKRLPDGQDFSAEHFGSDDAKSFGFTGSAQGYDEHPVAPPFAGDKPTDNGMSTEKYAEGGKVEHGKKGHEHPHGHHVVRVHHDPHSGAVIHHHAHGGYTMHHPDGHMTHHGADGQPAMAHGGPMPGGHHQEGTHVGNMRRKPAMDTAPRNQARNPSTRNAMPGGEMPMGVEPSAEPDEPDGDEGGSSGGAPMMAKGGMHHGRHRG